jgi:hypothetical protein
MLAHGFAIEQMVELVRAGLAPGRQPDRGLLLDDESDGAELGRPGRRIKDRPTEGSAAFPSRAIARKPSCLISCTHASLVGGCGALVGRLGGTKPGGRSMRGL